MMEMILTKKIVTKTGTALIGRCSILQFGQDDRSLLRGCHRLQKTRWISMDKMAWRAPSELTIQRRKEKKKRKLGVPFDVAFDEIRRKCDFVQSDKNVIYNTRVRLNLDMAIPGQYLKGMFHLPHPLQIVVEDDEHDQRKSGKSPVTRACVLTDDPTLAEQARGVGAVLAGGLELWERMRDRRIINLVEDFDCIISTRNLESVWSNPRDPLCRQLNHFEKFPMTEKYTLVEQPEDLIETVRRHVQGEYYPYKLRANGFITAPLGRVGIHRSQAVLENLQAVLQQLWKVQPPRFGNGPKADHKYRGLYVIQLWLGINRLGGSKPGQSIPKHVPLRLDATMKAAGLHQKGTYVKPEDDENVDDVAQLFKEKGGWRSLYTSKAFNKGVYRGDF
jgi:hypothetical protein